MAIPITELKNRLNDALSLKLIRPVELSAKTGIPKSSISQYMSGYAKPNAERVFLIARALNVSEAWLMGYDVPMERDPMDGFPSPAITSDYVTFPVIGDIAAGYDKIGYEDWSGDTIDVPTSYLKGHPQKDFFVLKVKGNSMYPLYHNGDKVLILKQSTLTRSGEIGAVLYNDEITTLKKVEFVQGEDWLILIPLNPEYPPERIEGEHLEHCRVLGIPKLLIREIE